MAFLKDDMAVEMIRESGGRTLNGRILRSGRLAVEYSLLFLPLSKCSSLFLPSSISRAAQESSSKTLMGAEWDDGTGQKIDWSLAVYVTPCSKSKELASNSPFHDHQLSFARRPKLFLGHYKTTISYGEGISFVCVNIYLPCLLTTCFITEILRNSPRKSLWSNIASDRFQVFQS